MTNRQDSADHTPTCSLCNERAAGWFGFGGSVEWRGLRSGWLCRGHWAEFRRDTEEAAERIGEEFARIGRTFTEAAEQIGRMAVSTERFARAWREAERRNTALLATVRALDEEGEPMEPLAIFFGIVLVGLAAAAVALLATR